MPNIINSIIFFTGYPRLSLTDSYCGQGKSTAGFPSNRFKLRCMREDSRLFLQAVGKECCASRGKLLDRLYKGHQNIAFALYCCSKVHALAASVFYLALTTNKQIFFLPSKY